MICISVVSHGHGAMVESLIARLLEFQEVSQIVLTRNIPEAGFDYADPRLTWLDNATPKGFGTNHNAALVHCNAPFFCVLNPDIALPENPFPALWRCLSDSDAAMVAPRILAPDGSVEDSARQFPTLASLARKAVLGDRGLHRRADSAPDWIAGMFMLWRREAFVALGGFDEGFFLYYEDVDICARARQSGLRIALCRQATAIHDARRESHRSWRFMRWHLTSMARFFFKHGGRQRRPRLS